MRNRILPVLSIGFPALVILIAVYSNIIAGSFGKSTDEAAENDALENAIILNGLEMNSEDPLEDLCAPGREGAIIFDEDFDDRIEAPAVKKEKTERRQALRPEDAAVKELRKRDSRWHLSKYRVKKGDNLWSIAKKFRTPHRLIILANAIDNPDRLKPGNTVHVPTRNGVTYTVRKGDTVRRIALAHNVTARSIIEHNSLRGAGRVIVPGKKIFLPGASAPEVRDGPEAREPGGKQVCRREEATRFAWPLRGKITSSFGNRVDPFSRTRKFHCGVDISVEPGTPVRAAADGKVIFSGWKDGYGNMVVLKHEKGYITVYAHNRENLVSENDAVSRGDLLAHSGMSGAVTGAHLHFEIRKYLTALNPLRLMR
jgi:murein DD-endopeptidase MepM/ murein hydrolase activator NlpD